MTTKTWMMIAGLIGAGLVGAPLRAQSAAGSGTVRGVVVDDSGTPIGAAHIRLIEVHREDVSHEDGAFQFTGIAPGRYTLVVRRIGYRPETRTVVVGEGSPDDVRITLHAAAVELPLTVVTGTLGERAAADALSAISVLEGAGLDSRLDGTIGATLAGEPGVAVGSLGPATARPVLRGLSGDRIVMLEDGQRMGDLSATSADHAVAADPIAAKRIEVVRGPMSLLYGSSALGGVVNVIRDEIPTGAPEHAHGAVVLQGTSVDRGGVGGGHVVLGRGPWAARLEGSARAAGDVHTPSGPLENTDVQTLGFALGAGFAAPWGHAGAAYRFYDNEYGIPGGFVGGHPDGVDIRMRRHNARAEVEHHGGGVWSPLRAAVAFTDYGHDEIEASGAVGTSFDQQLAALDLLAQHDALGPSAGGALGARAQYRDILTGGSLRTPSTYDVNLAAFVVEEFGRGPLRVQAGARFDWARYVPRDTTATIVVGGQVIPVRPRSFGSFSGSLGLLWALADGVRLGASVSRAYRTPDFNELYSDGPHLAANSYDVGDPSLDDEAGVGVDVFLRLDRGPMRVEVAAFGNELRGYIFPSSRGRVDIGPQGGRPRFQYTNEDARFTGLEADLEWSLTPTLVLDGTVSYVGARFTSMRDSIPVITPTDTSFVPASPYPPFIPPLHGLVQLRYDRPLLFAAAGARLAARQDRTGDFETATAGYVVGHVAAGVRLFAGSRLHSLTLRVDNLADRSYRDHLSRVKDLVPEPGRNVSLLYRLTF